MTYSKEQLLDVIKRLRDDMMTPMNPRERAEWNAKMAYMLTGILTYERLDAEEEAQRKK